jgi:hypothetical protein
LQLRCGTQQQIRFKFTRKLRVLFLLAAVVVIGFLKGGCPCMISSFTETMLGAFGAGKPWVNSLWFLGLIPVTYVFGRVVVVVSSRRSAEFSWAEVALRLPGGTFHGATHLIWPQLQIFITTNICAKSILPVAFNLIP